jgi:hypothetical protein
MHDRMQAVILGPIAAHGRLERSAAPAKIPAADDRGARAVERLVVSGAPAVTQGVLVLKKNGIAGSSRRVEAGSALGSVRPEATAPQPAAARRPAKR